MKISRDSKTIYTISDSEKSILKHIIQNELYEDDVKRRIAYWVKDNLFEKALTRLKLKWNKILKDRDVKSFPTNNIEYSKVLLSQPEFSSLPSFIVSSLNIDDVELFKISPEEKSIISIEYNKVDVDSFIDNQIATLIKHVLEQYIDRVRKEWEPKLIKDGATSINSDDKIFMSEIKKRPDYKDRSAREEDNPFKEPIDKLKETLSKQLNAVVSK